MNQARAAGLPEGYTVPIHIPGEASGLVSFVTADGRELPSDSLPAAQYLACFAFEPARRLKVQQDSDDPPEGPKLTQRQLDCLVLAARGKSNYRGTSCWAWRAAQSTSICRPARHLMASPPAPNWR